MKIPVIGPYMAWIKAGAIVLVLAAAFAAGYRYRDARADAQVATIREQVANDARAQIEVAQKRAYDADEALRKALEAPKAAPQIRTIIRENPSSCVVPAPVARGLRDAIRGGNKSISGQRG